MALMGTLSAFKTTTMANHLYDLLRSGAKDPEKTFAELTDGRWYRYQDVDDVSARFANALVDLGVEPGDRVAVQVEKSIEAIMLYLGTIRAGAVFLPLNTAYTAAEIEYFVGDAEPRVFVCDPVKADALRPIAAKAGARLETLGVYRSPDVSAGTLSDRTLAAPPRFDDVARGPDDLGAILYTSGTTGRSKGAMLTHDNLASNAATLAATWRFTPDDVLIHALPIFHTHGLFVATNTVLVGGAGMIFLNRFDPDKVFEVMPRATAMMGVPTFYTRLLQDPRLTAEATQHMRLFISGSAPLLAETHREWQARTGHAILERYGMTETGMTTSNPYEGERIAGTVGFPLPGVEIRVADPETGTPLGTDEIGMIEIRGPNVFKGYWRMPEKTAAEFRDPKEVESEIDAIDGVVESAVIGLAHPDFGEGVTAVVVKSGEAGLTEKDVLGRLETRLAKFKLPKQVIFVDDLPRNTMGKVQKNILRDTYGTLYAQVARP
jgi:malonyl-CoA/methylmalonyl-CoA synthetase